MSFLGGFNAQAIAADSKGLNSLKCSHCGAWVWTEKTQAQLDAGERTWCSTRACEAKEGEVRAAERAALAIKDTTIGQERDGHMAYHSGQCSHCSRQFMSDYDGLYIVTMTKPGYARIKFCHNSRCERAAVEFARKHS